MTLLVFFNCSKVGYITPITTIKIQWYPRFFFSNSLLPSPQKKRKKKEKKGTPIIQICVHTHKLPNTELKTTRKWDTHTHTNTVMHMYTHTLTTLSPGVSKMFMRKDLLRVSGKTRVTGVDFVLTPLCKHKKHKSDSSAGPEQRIFKVLTCRALTSSISCWTCSKNMPPPPQFPDTHTYFKWDLCTHLLLCEQDVCVAHLQHK